MAVLTCSLVAAHASAAVGNYFDANGTGAGLGVPVTGTTYDWDDTSTGGLWNTASDGTGTNAAWFGTANQGGFPRFTQGSAAVTGPPAVPATSYTVTLGNDEQTTGLYETINGVNLTLNSSGAGTLELLPLSPAGTTDGILNGGSNSTLTINAVISGAGIANPSNGGNILFNGVNTYTGGTALTSTATLVNFNNASSFGTGAITSSLTSTTGFAPLIATGGATITLANAFSTGAGVGAGFNFASNANTPVVSTGAWTMGKTTLLRNNGNATSPLTISGAMTGAGGLVVSGANGGTINFNGVAKAYAGTTTLGASGATAITLKLGVANAIAGSSSLILAGGKLDPGGFGQALTATTLAMTATSSIDFGSGAAEVDFANSSALTWTGTLNLLNFDAAIDKLRFGTDANGLNAAQVKAISINGVAGNATLDAGGFLVVPEPTTLACLAAPATLLMRRRRIF